MNRPRLSRRYAAVLATGAIGAVVGTVGIGAVVSTTVEAPTPPVEPPAVVADPAPVVEPPPAPTPVLAPALALDETPTLWSLTASGAMVPLTSGRGILADGTAAYVQGGTLKLRRPDGSLEQVAKAASNTTLIPGGPVELAAGLVAKSVTVWTRGATGKWTSTSIGYTTGSGTPTLSGCVDSHGDGHLVVADSPSMDDQEGVLVAVPIVASVPGAPVTLAGDDEATAPSVVCSETGPDEVVWRHQLSRGAEVWHGLLEGGKLTDARAILPDAFDPHFAAGWIGYHDATASTHLAQLVGGAWAPVKVLSETSHFAAVAVEGKIVASVFGEWPTKSDAADATKHQDTRRARMQVSLDGGATWTSRDPWGTSTGYGPCGVVVAGGAVRVVCRSPEGVAGAVYGVR